MKDERGENPEFTADPEQFDLRSQISDLREETQSNRKGAEDAKNAKGESD